MLPVSRRSVMKGAAALLVAPALPSRLASASESSPSTLGAGAGASSPSTGQATRIAARSRIVPVQRIAACL